MLVEVQVMHRPLPRRPSTWASFAPRKAVPRGPVAARGHARTRVRGSSAKYVVAFPGQTRPSRVIP